MRKVPQVLVLLDKSRAADRQFLRGIVRYSHLLSAWQVRTLDPFYRHPSGKLKILSLAKSQQVDGIIANIDNAKMAKALTISGLPAIVIPIKELIPGFPCIFDDADTVGKMAAEHLLSLGLRNFAFCGFENLCWSRARSEDFSKRITKADFQTSFYNLPSLKNQRLWENQQIILADWLTSLPKPVGLMACNDECGQHILEACQVANMRVPDEVAVIGVDNDDLICDLTTPPLSSVALNHENTGYQAAQLLDKIMSGKEVDSKSIIFLEASHVVTRQSTDVLAIVDHEVAEAVRFIHRHSNEAIQVSDVVESVTVSRRILERRFREVLNKSVHDEIRRARVERACRLLLETNLNVSQIVLHLGYPSDKHISRQFRKEKGMTPSQYRKKFAQK